MERNWESELSEIESKVNSLTWKRKSKLSGAGRTVNSQAWNNHYSRTYWHQTQRDATNRHGMDIKIDMKVFAIKKLETDMQIIWKLAETWVTLSRFRWNNTNKFAMLCINLRNPFHQKQYIEQETNIWWCNNDTKTAVVSACQVAWEVWRLDPGRTNLQEIYGTMWKMCCSCLGFSKLGSMQEFPQNSSLIPMKLHMMVLNCFRYLGFQQWQCGSSNITYQVSGKCSYPFLVSTETFPFARQGASEYHVHVDGLQNLHSKFLAGFQVHFVDLFRFHSMSIDRILKRFAASSLTSRR